MSTKQDQLTTDDDQAVRDYERVAAAIDYINDHFQEQPSLEAIAASVALSQYHFQRLFKRWAGVSPTQFLGSLTLDYAKRQLEASRTLLDTALDAGLSGPGRLHDLFVTYEAMSPGEYKRGGAGLTITVGMHPTCFGNVLVGTTPRGICALRFVENEAEGVAALRAEWPNATFVTDYPATRAVVATLFDPPEPAPIQLLLKGTNFQVQVWRALLQLPAGTMVSYADVARMIGKPTATRAVASAIGRNPIGYVIPCHRVITSAGKIHRYRWGAARKHAILGFEAVAGNSAAANRAALGQ